VQNVSTRIKPNNFLLDASAMGSFDIPVDSAGESVFIGWVFPSFAGLVLRKFEPCAYPHFHLGLA
jgi:hypothetical protein